MSGDLLLDTHVLLWLATDDRRWGQVLDSQLDDPACTITISAASWLEIAIKRAIGKLDLDTGSMRRCALRAGLLELPITAGHAEQLELLPHHHRDPFDRILIAQALVEEMTIATADPAFRAYEGLRLLPERPRA